MNCCVLCHLSDVALVNPLEQLEIRIIRCSCDDVGVVESTAAISEERDDVEVTAADRILEVLRLT